MELDKQERRSREEKTRSEVVPKASGILKRRESDGEIFLAEDTDLRRSEMGEFLGVNKIPGEASRVGGGWV